MSKNGQEGQESKFIKFIKDPETRAGAVIAAGAVITINSMINSEGVPLARTMENVAAGLTITTIGTQMPEKKDK